MMTMGEAVGQRIQYYMDQYNANRKEGEEKLTINSLAKKANLTQSTLSDIMRGVNKHPKISTLSHIVKPFGITIGEFFNDPMFDEAYAEPIKPRTKKQNEPAD